MEIFIYPTNITKIDILIHLYDYQILIIDINACFRYFYRYIFPFMSIGENIKMVREAKKLSQKQVALSIDMDPSQYSKIEKGKTDPSVSTVEKISAALGVSLSELFQSDEIFKDINSIDKTIMEKIKLIEQLDDQEKNSLFNIIDGLFAKKRLKDSLSSALSGV
jgi:transcriptional regulator with XRE-family HTH domain